MALFAALAGLADVGFSLADRFFPENDVGGFRQPASSGTSLPTITQTVDTDVRVGAPTLSQVVSIGGRAVPVVAPSTSFPAFQPSLTTPAFFDEVTRFEGPTTVQNIPWPLLLGAAVAAFALAKLT